jgi:TolA-binding protein
MIHVDKFINSKIYIKKRGVKMTQTQTFKAPIYTIEELEERLKKLSREVEHLSDLWLTARIPLDRIHTILYKKTSVSDSKSSQVDELISELREAIHNAIEEMIINELQLDTDIEKYEREYNVKFTYETERLLGVVMIKDNDTIKPVAIWTDYREIWYYEGEKN